MKKDYFSITKKFLLIVVITLFSTIQIGYSQCTNPTPTGTSPQTFCKTDNSTVADLVASGGTIVWYDAATGGTQYAPSNPLFDGTTYYADDISNNNCSINRLAVLVSIVGDVPTNVDVYVGKCASQNPTIADLNATGTNIEWFDAQTGGSLLDSTTPLADGQTYWVQQTESGCTSVRLPTTVSLIDPTTPTVEPIQSFCYPPNPTVGDLQATGTNIVWYDTENSTTPLNSTDNLIDGEDYWAAESDASSSCESINRLQVTVTITDNTPVTITETTQTFCASDEPTVENLDVTGSNINWYESETATTPLSINELLVDGEDYWATQTNTSGCESSTRMVVYVVLTDPGTPTINTSGNEFCIIDNPTVSNLNNNVTSSNSNPITWYDNYPNGNMLNLSDPLINGNTYYAIETDTNGCSSTTPLQVTVNLDACDQYDVEIFDGFSPDGDGINDTFEIGNLKALYPNFKLEFYNRWGKLIYTQDATKPNWNGRLNGNGNLVPAGVYYFIIHFNKNNRKPIQKRLYLNR
jgi:gliding motility-associated-like protein